MLALISIIESLIKFFLKTQCSLLTRRFVGEFGTHYATTSKLGTRIVVERRYSIKERSRAQKVDNGQIYNIYVYHYPFYPSQKKINQNIYVTFLSVIFRLTFMDEKVHFITIAWHLEFDNSFPKKHFSAAKATLELQMSVY